MAGKKKQPDSLLLKQPDMELEKVSVEQLFEWLDGILEKLEDKEVSLEDSFSYYETGIALVKACHEKLDQVEKKILVLNGQEMEEP